MSLLLASDIIDPNELAGLGGELLEGVDVASSPEFESWLLVERHRVSATIEAGLRQAAVALLAGGRPKDAVGYASRAVARNPLEQGNHELLVRSLAMSGDQTAALRQVAVCEDILRRELGVEASAALREAATTGSESSMVPPLSGRAAATLAALAARCDMREFVVRTQLYRSRLGDRTSLASARRLAADIDNPALADLLTAATTR